MAFTPLFFFFLCLALVPTSESLRSSSHVETAVQKTNETNWSAASEDSEWPSLYEGLKDSEHTQKFEVTEYQYLGGHKYRFELEETNGKNETNAGKDTVGKEVDMDVTPHAMTMHGTLTVKIGRKVFLMFRPNMVTLPWVGLDTWHVTPKDKTDHVLFTIQKSRKGAWRDSWGSGAFARLWRQKVSKHKQSSWRIYQGPRDHDQVLYYGRGKTGDLDELEFKFYHGKEEYNADDIEKTKYAAKIEHKKGFTKYGQNEDVYKVSVKPGEDAAILLLAVPCMDALADDSQKQIPPPQNGQ